MAAFADDSDGDWEQAKTPEAVRPPRLFHFTVATQYNSLLQDGSPTFQLRSHM